MAVVEGALFLGFAPEHLVVAVRVERRVDVDEIHAGVRQVAELVEVVAAVDHPGIDERAGFYHAGKMKEERRRVKDEVW